MKESVRKLVRWEIGDGDVSLATQVVRLPVLRAYVVDISTPARTPRDIIDLVLPNVESVEELRDSLNQYLTWKKAQVQDSAD